MNKRYFGLWSLLTVALAAFIAYSCSEQNLSIGDLTLKKASFANALIKEQELSSKYDISSDTIPLISKVETDSASQSILLIGDSMTLNIALRMEQYAKQNGHIFHAVNWDSSNTKIWAESDTLQYYMSLYKPTFIFISLGSNEVYFKNPESRLPYINKILSKIGNIPYVWIGPPNWNEDTGINDVITNATQKGCFFLSEGIKLARKGDHIHPTRTASAIWVDTLARWLPKSAHPILMDPPTDSISNTSKHIVILKALNK
jgi:hypothetical protein